MPPPAARRLPSWSLSSGRPRIPSRRPGPGRAGHPPGARAPPRVGPSMRLLTAVGCAAGLLPT
eukprot:481331-Alexandrium_andersonii.AAC.1